MSDVELRQADRLRVMRAIYELTGDDTMQYVGLWDVRDAIGLDDDRMGNAVDFLEGAGMISALRTLAGQRTPIQARIQHAGVVEMERSKAAAPTDEKQRTPPRATITPSGLSEILEALRRPNSPTQHLPPVNSINVFNIGGSVSGSPFQVASPGASQNTEPRVETVPSGGVRQVNAFFSGYYMGDHKARLIRELDSDAHSEFLCELNTLHAQVISPRPKAVTIRLSVSTMRRLLAKVPNEQNATLIRLLDQVDV